MALRRTLPSLILLAAAASFAVSGCRSSEVSGAAAAAAAPPPPPEVGVHVVAAQPVTLSTELPGRTVAYGIAEVRPQVNGIVRQRLFREGSDVRAGSVLYTIDPAPYQTALDSARAALSRSEANLAVAQVRAQRFRDLVAIDAVSQQENDDAVATQKLAEASIASDKAAIRAAQINLGYTRVTAPIAGRIGRSTVTAGALVTANQPDALAVVQQLDPIYVDVTQSSGELLRLRRELAAGRLKSAGGGQASVSLLFEDGSPYGAPGRLQFSDVTVDERTGAVTLRAVFPNPSRELLPGMYVRAVVEEGTAEHALLVPQKGVTRDPRGKATALVVSADNKVEPRALTTSRSVGDRWLVTAGLVAGDRVIVEGLQKVRPGATVRVAAAPAGPGSR